MLEMDGETQLPNAFGCDSEGNDELLVGLGQLSLRDDIKNELIRFIVDHRALF